LKENTIDEGIDRMIAGRRHGRTTPGIYLQEKREFEDEPACSTARNGPI
jgi:hypothetical protein